VEISGVVAVKLPWPFRVVGVNLNMDDAGHGIQSADSALMEFPSALSRRPSYWHSQAAWRGFRHAAS
jgi:hypothetical protein